ncbi:MAG: Ni/Fe-hydrogenase, b-type cytochrome subunit [Bacteroidales bacterium]
MITKKANLQEVYVWQLPVRIFHWVNAFCIIVLCVTGYIIGDPPAIMHGTQPEQNYWFGWIRLAHFIAAFIFMTNFIVRIYWMFAGNTFAQWHNYIPLTKKQWRGITETVNVDVLLLSPKPIYDIGHNSLAAFTYFGIFVIMAIQSLTGLGMFYASSDSIVAPPFEAGLQMSGGFFTIRYIHHILMWTFILFSIAHIYLVFYHDYIERNGIASSIIGGWKFIDTRLVNLYRKEINEHSKLKTKREEDKKAKKQKIK